MLDEKTYRMVPTRRGPDGWYQSWTATSLEEATSTATAFLDAEKVPVLITESDPDGRAHRQVTTIGGEVRRRR